MAELWGEGDEPLLLVQVGGQAEVGMSCHEVRPRAVRSRASLVVAPGLKKALPEEGLMSQVLCIKGSSKIAL